MKQWNIIFFTIWLSDEMFLAKIENYKKKKKKSKCPKLCLFDFWLGFMWILLMQMSELIAFGCSKWFVKVLWSGQYCVWHILFLFTLFLKFSVVPLLFIEIQCSVLGAVVSGCNALGLFRFFFMGGKKTKNRSMLFCVKAHTRPPPFPVVWFFSKNSC